MKEHYLAFLAYLLCFTITSSLPVLITGPTVAGDKVLWNSSPKKDEPHIGNTGFFGWNFAVGDDGQSLRRRIIKSPHHQAEIFSTLRETSKKQRPTFDPGWRLMGLGKRTYTNQPFYNYYNGPLMLDGIDTSNENIQTARHPEFVLVGYDRGVKDKNSGQSLHVNELSSPSLSNFFDKLISSSDSEEGTDSLNVIDHSSLNTDEITRFKPRSTVYESHHPEEFYLKLLGSRMLGQRRNVNKRNKKNEKNLKIEEPHKMFLAVLTMNNLRRFFDELTKELEAKDESLGDYFPEPLTIRPAFVVKTHDKGRTHTENKKPWILWQEKSKPNFDPGWNWPGLGRK
ncbi:uncharacterized protein LOC111085403 [Limulus polyphemus]|uniref:Uncharacterized protein LOC111085403 n=1 Tax=Limulus polyphemus TaxID=6850 RepID=A0ABM1S791_LIMPO|nr:uncharacterized protein LOC111085403 [Limulus polyphemus]